MKDIKVTTFSSEDESVKHNGQTVNVRIPDCCREGWSTCPHVVQNDRERKRKNIGL